GPPPPLRPRRRRRVPAALHADALRPLLLRGGRAPRLWWPRCVECAYPSRRAGAPGATERSLALRDVAADHVDDALAERRERLPGAEVALEDLGKGRAVGDVEEAERADQPVEVDRVDAVAEDPLAH